MSPMTGQMRQTKITFHFNYQKQSDQFQENILVKQTLFLIAFILKYRYIFKNFSFTTKLLFYYFDLKENEFAQYSSGVLKFNISSIINLV